MVAAFGILILAALFIEAGISGRSLAEVVRGEVGRGFALADIKLPSIVTQSGSTQAASLGGTGVTGGTGLLECFYDPLGYYFDSGKVVQGSIGGHSDHVHVAAEHPLIDRLAATAHTQFRLTIREFAPYDPVSPVHVSGSYHYQNKAFDASGSAADMRAFATYVIRSVSSGSRSA